MTAIQSLPFDMSPMARFFEVVHVVALGVWVGTLSLAAVVAAIIFPTMRSLQPTFAYFDTYDGSHADIGAGFIQARVFAAADIVQFVAACLAILGLVAATLIRRNLRSAWTMARCVLLGCTVIMLSYHLFILAPRMDGHARVYWEAAAAGDNNLSRSSHEAFMRDHPGAMRTTLFLGLFTLSTLCTSTFALTGGCTRNHAQDEVSRS